MGDLDTVVAAIDKHGLLLLQDKQLPSVVGLLTGEAVSGSWWAHPMAHRIFACLQQLTHRQDSTAVHLVDGKVTFVHRRLWPALLAVAQGNEPWQTRALSADARALLQRVQQEPSVRATGAAVRQLQDRLLVHGEQEHTESGHHAYVLQTWEAWRVGRAMPVGTGMKAFEGQLHIETTLKQMGGALTALPWQRGKRAGSRR